MGGGFPSPERDDDGRRLGAGCDQGDDEEEDQEGDEGVAGAVALPRHGVAVLVQVGFDDDQLQLVDLATRGRRDDLSALHAAAIGVVPYLSATCAHGVSDSRADCRRGCKQSSRNRHLTCARAF